MTQVRRLRGVQKSKHCFSALFGRLKGFSSRQAGIEPATHGLEVVLNAC